jgi:hypothetical protein
MNNEYPDFVPRLHQPYFFDRQREHSETDKKTIFTPLLCNEDGRLRVRVSRNLIYQGYKLEGAILDETSEAALDAFFSVIDDPKMFIEFQFKPGQIQFLNNRLIGHKRTSFKDLPEKDMKRKLCRVWLRETGKRFYNG